MYGYFGHQILNFLIVKLIYLTSKTFYKHYFFVKSIIHFFSSFQLNPGTQCTYIILHIMSNTDGFQYKESIIKTEETVQKISCREYVLNNLKLISILSKILSFKKLGEQYIKDRKTSATAFTYKENRRLQKIWYKNAPEFILSSQVVPMCHKIVPNRPKM